MEPDRTGIVEWPTLLLLALTYAVWATGTMIWQDSALLSLLLTSVAIAQHASLQHEAHPLPSVSQRPAE